MLNGRSPTLVLVYHRIAEVRHDPQLLCVGPTRFVEHLKIVRQYADVVLLAAVSEKSKERRVAITFDDGYCDNALVAAPILGDAGLPASFFVTSGMVGTRKEFWWDRLQGLLFGERARPDHLNLEVSGRNLWIDIRSEPGTRRAYWALHTRLRNLSISSIEETLGALEGQLGRASPNRETHRVMSEEEIKDLASSDLFQIGSHTVSHPLLSVLDPSEQEVEIKESKARLEGLTGRPVNAFAYPYGGADAYNEVTVQLVQEAGYDLAFTNEQALVTKRSHPLRIARFLVRDWTDLQLSHHLSQWFGG